MGLEAECEVVVDAFARPREIAAGGWPARRHRAASYRWVSSGRGILRLIERTGAEQSGLQFRPEPHFSGRRRACTTWCWRSAAASTARISPTMKATPTPSWQPRRETRSTGRRSSPLSMPSTTAGPITLELEDAPGASHWTHFREATPEFDDEMPAGHGLSRRARAAELGISIQKQT